MHLLCLNKILLIFHSPCLFSEWLKLLTLICSLCTSLSGQDLLLGTLWHDLMLLEDIWKFCCNLLSVCVLTIDKRYISSHYLFSSHLISSCLYLYDSPFDSLCHTIAHWLLGKIIPITIFFFFFPQKALFKLYQLTNLTCSNKNRNITYTFTKRRSNL